MKREYAHGKHRATRQGNGRAAIYPGGIRRRREGIAMTYSGRVLLALETLSGSMTGVDREQRAATRYIEAFSWTKTIQKFLDQVVKEHPLLNVCSGRTPWGDVTMDKYESSDVKGDWTSLPFDDNSFGAVFADPPWNAGYKKEVAQYVAEAMRVAPVCYLMAPWIYGSKKYKLTRCWIRQFPGVNNAIVLSRYERA